MSVIEALPDLAGELVGYAPAPSMVKHFASRTPDGAYPTVTSQSPGQLKIMVNTAGCGDSTSKGGVTRDSPIDSPMKTLHNNTPSLRDTTDKPVKIRSLTLPETLVLQGFNPDYDLSAARTMKSRWTMVGNAVPPPVAEAVIRGIANAEAN